MNFPQKTVAIFGATGGTGLAILRRCLDAGLTVNVLVRTPSKLGDFSAKYPNLHIIEGNIHNSAVVKSTLITNGKTVDIVISAIGMVLSGKRMGFNSENSHICEEGTKALLAAIYELEREQKVVFPIGGPEMVLLSTTGISDRGRDIPCAMIPLYHWMLSVPHDDKKKMEDLMIKGEGSMRRWILVRPSFLCNGESRGLKSVRVSTESSSSKEKEQEDVAIGYTINREDVALWIMEECVKKDSGKWLRKMVTLTY